MLGRQVSHYRILELIREGGMGAVYKAQDLNLPRLVAIKVVKRSQFDDPRATEMFLREALAVSRIDHPNVITLFEVIEQDGIHFIIMQYIDGMSLRDRLVRGLPTVAEAVGIAREVAVGLGAAHAIDVVHRDLKPDNVMQSSSGSCKVLDFGIAHLMNRSTLRDRSELIGTLRYMSPEQVRGETPDPRTDVYSLGVLLFELLTGAMPAIGESEAAIMGQILNVKPPPVSTLRRDIPDDLTQIVSRALEKDRADRYQTMSQMASDLAIVQRRLKAESDATTRTFHARRSRWRGRLIATLAVAAALVMGYGVWQRLPTRAPTILVMKWENTTRDPSLDWLCDGIMDCLIRALSGREGLYVVSRQTVSSALAAGPRVLAGLVPSGPAGIANEVGARYMATGNIETRGDVVHVNCELIDVRRGTLIHTWSSDLPNPKSQFYPMIDDFAASIASKVVRHPGHQHSPPGVSATLTSSFEALRLYNEALERNELTDTHAAVEYLRQATALDTTFTDAHLLLAQLTPEHAERDAHLTLAMKYRFKASRLTQRLVEAEQLMADDQVSAARAKYEEILADDPGNLSARTSLANIDRAERRFNDATAEFAVMRRLNPFDYSFFPDWMNAYVDAGRKDRALALAEQWRKQFPEEPEPLESLIGLHSWLGNYEVGMALCDTLARLSPDSDLLLRGIMLVDLDRLRAADSVFQRLEHRSNLGRSVTLGTTYRAYLAYRRQRYADGLTLIRGPLVDQPGAFNSWVAGLLSAAAHDTAAAHRHALTIASGFSSAPGDSLDPDAFLARRFYYHLRGVIALDNQEPAKAVDSFRSALRYAGRGDDPFFRTYLARALIGSGDSRSAIAELERALEFNPRDPESLLNLGDALVRTRQYDEAQRVLRALDTLWKGGDRDDPLHQEMNRLLKVAASRGG